MKIDKEYPATHSMATSWFAVDEDGNVALIEFGDNGPAPHVPSEVYLPELVLEHAAHETDIIPTASYTEEQINEILGDCVDEDGCCGTAIVELKRCREDEFIKWARMQNEKSANSRAVIRLNPKLDYYAINNGEQGELVRKKWFYNVYDCNLSIDEDWNKETSSVEWEKSFKYAPYYVFGQPYSNNHRISKAHTPVHPVKIDQLPTHIQESAIKLPIRFAETEKFQIADYVECSSYGGQTFEHQGQCYELLPDSNGEMVYIASGKRNPEAPYKLSVEEVSQLKKDKKYGV